MVDVSQLTGATYFRVEKYADPTAADCTQGFLNLASAVQAAGGGVVEFPAGKTYTVLNTFAPVEQFVLLNFSNLSGLSIRMNGSRIVTPANLNGTGGATPINVYGMLCVNCSDVDFDLRFEQTVYNAKNYLGGFQGAFFQGTCQNVRGKLKMLGGKLGVCVNRDSTVAITAAQHAMNFDLEIYTVNTFYPLNCQYTGYDVRALLFTENAGRSYFVYNCGNHHVTIFSSDQQNGYDDVLIKAYAMPNGSGGATGVPSAESVTSNITVVYKSRGSSGNVSDDAPVEIAFDQNPPTNAGAYYPGRISNVNVTLDVDETGVVQPGSIIKFSRSGYQGVNDTTTVAHVLDNIKVGGVVRGLAGATTYATRLVDFFRYNGGAVVDPTGMLASNVDFADLISDEAITIPPTIGVDGRCLVTPVRFSRVRTKGPFDVANVAPGMLIATDVITGNYQSPDVYQRVSYTFSQLTPSFVSGLPAGLQIFVTDGREPGQAAGAGTGVFAYKRPSDGTMRTGAGSPLAN